MGGKGSGRIKILNIDWDKKEDRNIYQKEWRQTYYSTHPEYREKLRQSNKLRFDYFRHNVMCINGKHVTVRKRRFQGYCELCGRTDLGRGKAHHLYYHHWDDKHPEYGIWVCFWCHRYCEAVDDDSEYRMMEKYKCLKKQITK